jgi:intermediate peptidase
MALLADFGNPGAQVRDVRLGMREVKVLLHEWGHCCHNLLSRTKYQHLWGTRCAQDVVELPSHLWEYFALDPRSLAYLVRHHATLEPLPAGAASALAFARRQFAALELQQQASEMWAPVFGGFSHSGRLSIHTLSCFGHSHRQGKLLLSLV